MRITNPGRLNSRLEFYVSEKYKDDWGEWKTQEKLIHKCWSAIRVQYLAEVRANIGTVLENTTTFIIRYKQAVTITNDMKIKHNGVLYEIVKINPDLSKKEYTTIIAEAVS